MAAVDFFLKIDGIEGESQDKKHKNEIDVQSWSLGAQQSGAHAVGGGGGAGRSVVQDFHFTMQTNKASPNLALACLNGQHIKSAVLVCRKAGKDQQEYLKITFSDLLVSSYQAGGSQGEILPVDQVSLNFSKVEMAYAPQKADGTLDSPKTITYNVKERAAA